MNTTLPTDSDDRKNYALFSGCLRYFPAALAGISKTSKLGNDKHNPGQELHHARNKSSDHGDCIVRHLIDLEDLRAAMKRGETVDKEAILNEVSSMAWRALALSQQLHETFGAPLAPGASNETKDTATNLYDEGEKAQEKVRKMVEDNKRNIFNVKKSDPFFRGDIIKHIDNDVEVIIEAIYYDEKGNQVLFVKDPSDPQSKTIGVNPNFYKSIYKDKI